MATYLEKIREIKENNNYDIELINAIVDKMEEQLGSAEMWNILRPGFDINELLENLEYIASEADI